MNGMIRKLRRSTLLLLIALLCLACGLSEEVQLNDMSAYADRVQEELPTSRRPTPGATAGRRERFCWTRRSMAGSARPANC